MMEISTIGTICASGDCLKIEYSHCYKNGSSVYNFLMYTIYLSKYKFYLGNTRYIEMFLKLINVKFFFSLKFVS